MNTSTSVRMLQRASKYATRRQFNPTQSSWLVASRQFHQARQTPPTALRKHLQGATLTKCQCRHESSESSRPLTDRNASSEEDAEEQRRKEEIAARKAQEPAYEMTFTCRKCLTRSQHRITKQAYHFGTTLVTCPGCKNRHLISDHLKIFSDTSITIEDILREKGQYLQKGRLGADGDVEFYDDSKPLPDDTTEKP